MELCKLRIFCFRDVKLRPFCDLAVFVMAGEHEFVSMLFSILIEGNKRTA